MELTGKKICVLGDSITQGCCASAPERGFVEILKRILCLSEAGNYGIGGTRIARQRKPSADPRYDLDFCGRYADMMPDADVILVFGGTNDHGHGDAPLGEPSDRTPDTFWGACHTLFSGLLAQYPQARIVVLTPLHRVGEEDVNPSSGALLRDYVDVLRSAARHYCLPVLDLYETSAIRANLPEIASTLTTDGLHPNDDGHALLAEEIAAYLRALE